MNTSAHTKGSIVFTEETADTNGQERDIDQQVYAPYGLTPEEMKIVEAAATAH